VRRGGCQKKPSRANDLNDGVEGVEFRLGISGCAGTRRRSFFGVEEALRREPEVARRKATV